MSTQGRIVARMPDQVSGLGSFAVVDLQNHMAEVRGAAARVHPDHLMRVALRKAGQNLTEARRDDAAAFGFGLIRDEDDVERRSVFLQQIADLAFDFERQVVPVDDIDARPVFDAGHFVDQFCVSESRKPVRLHQQVR